jgi:hypothetical protein
MISILFSCSAHGESVLFREDFRNLDNWKPVTFPKITQHTSYVIQSDKDGSFLRAESSASASGLVWKRTFSVYEYPKARWRWKVDNVYQTAARPVSKSCDDYPVRVYFVFEYQPENSSLVDRIKYGAAKTIYGEYPPHSALNYVWSSTDWGRDIITSPYTGKMRLIALRRGREGLGQWQNEEVNVLEDYRRAFGVDPPRTATVAIMNDSDDTGERSVSYVGFVEVYR